MTVEAQVSNFSQDIGNLSCCANCVAVALKTDRDACGAAQKFTDVYKKVLPQFWW